MKRLTIGRRLLSAGLIFGTALLSVSSRPSLAGTLYQTGFEPPQFQAGQTVDGQGGFAVTTGSPGAITVTTSNPFAGSQSLLFTGSDLTDSGGGFYVGTAAVATNYDAAANQTPIITLESQVLLSGPSTNMGPNGGTTGDLVSINLEASLGDGSYFSTYLSSDGHAYGFTTNYDFSTPVTLGVYHDLKLVIDFADRTSTFSVDGQAFGTQPFAASVSSTVLSSAQFTMYDIDPPADRTAYTAQADNFSVTATPEPSTLTLLGIGAVGLAGAARRRARAS